jgi:predicted nuclease of predicted toxin-antitoxin system
VTRLFFSLYLDEDVDVLVADLVRARGFDVITTVGAGRLHQSDDEQLAFAAAEERVLLTHNRVDFEQLATEYFAANRSHTGIIIAVRRSPYEVARRVLVLFNQVTADEMENQIRYI